MRWRPRVPLFERINPRIREAERKTKVRVGEVSTHGRKDLGTNRKDLKETIARAQKIWRDQSASKGAQSTSRALERLSSCTYVLEAALKLPNFKRASFFLPTYL